MKTLFCLFPDIHKRTIWRKKLYPLTDKALLSAGYSQFFAAKIPPNAEVQRAVKITFKSELQQFPFRKKKGEGER